MFRPAKPTEVSGADLRVAVDRALEEEALPRERLRAVAGQVRGEEGTVGGVGGCSIVMEGIQPEAQSEGSGEAGLRISGH